MKSESSEYFAEGIRLFNQGNYFEAHEVWEKIWKNVETEQKIFYQGMIQAAAALVHVQRGNYRGAVSLYSKSRGKLDQLPTVWMGIDVEQFRGEFARYFKALRTSSGSGHEDLTPAGQIAINQRPPNLRWTIR
jgi:uncharacterized protein